MSIQFYCSSCRQPIEVDDVHAGQVAACPYCQHVVTVPAESTIQPATATPAQPIEPGPSRDFGVAPRTGGGQHVALREAAARSFGNFALICAVLMLLCWTTSAIMNLATATGSSSPPAATQPDPHGPAQQTPEEQLRRVLQDMQSNPWQLGVSCASVLFALTGIVLAVISLIQVRRANRRAVSALIICGGFLLLQCVGSILLFLLAAGGAFGVLPG